MPQLWHYGARNDQVWTVMALEGDVWLVDYDGFTLNVAIMYKNHGAWKQT